MRLQLVVLSLLPLALSGCGNVEKSVAPQPLAGSSFSTTDYNVVVKNRDESVILLGQFRFSPTRNDTITGTWALSPWGGGSAIPGLPGSGGLSGTYLGGTAALQLDLPGTASSLGVFAEGMVDGRMTGRVSLLPSGGFEGRFEAIAIAKP